MEISVLYTMCILKSALIPDNRLLAVQGIHFLLNMFNIRTRYACITYEPTTYVVASNIIFYMNSIVHTLGTNC